MTQEDPRDKSSLTHEDVVALNFVRAPGIYVYRRHFRAGPRSHLMQVLPREDLDRQRAGVLVNGVRRFPEARPLKMPRIFRTRFKTLRQAEEELVRFKIIESYLAPLHMARSNEFLVDFTREGRSPPTVPFTLSDQPRPIKGIFVAMIVMNWTLVSRGRLAM